MIHEVDSALLALVKREAVDTTDVEVVLDAPTKDWANRRNAPTVNCYLYDIREDLRRRERGLLNRYDDAGRVRGRHPPPRFIKLSYLVTAWTQRPEDEHRLLSFLLVGFLRYEALPPDLLVGPLAEQGVPVPMTVALPPPEDRSFADVWTALGGELKPSIDVVVSAPVPAGRFEPAAGLVLESTRVGMTGMDGVPAREEAPRPEDRDPQPDKHARTRKRTARKSP